MDVLRDASARSRRISRSDGPALLQNAVARRRARARLLPGFQAGVPARTRAAPGPVCALWSRTAAAIIPVLLASIRRRNVGDAVHPRQRGAPPDLPSRRECRALGDAVHAQRVALRVLDGTRVDWSPAIVAESMAALGAALGRLDIALRRAAPEHELRCRRWDVRAKCRAGEALAVGAVAQRDRGRIDLGLEGDLSAVAAPVDLHASGPTFDSVRRTSTSIGLASSRSRRALRSMAAR